MKPMTALVVIALPLCGAWFYADPISSKLLIPLLVSGALAGFAQSLIENKNTIVLPGPGAPGTYNLGFVADILIGMVGAFASLILGLTVLNDRFFIGPLPADAGPSKALADLVLMIPTWVRIASYGALTGYASRRLLPDLSSKVAGMVSGALKTEMKKQRQNQVEIARTQAELSGMMSEALRERVHAQPLTAVIEGAPAPASPMTQLTALVRKYMALSARADDERLRLKNQVADLMLATALRSGVTVESIAAQVEPEPAERDGWLAALATLIAVAPNPGDGAWLLGAAAHVTDNFVRYRILLALYNLEAHRLLSGPESAQARQFIEACLTIDDPAVRRKARATLEFFDIS
jgi:hypothetical protein